MTTLRFDPATQPASQLRLADPTLGRVIDAVGPLELTLRDDAFASLARAIVGQQLSVLAAQTIWGRFSAMADPPTPSTVAMLDEPALRGAGLSRAKAAYVRDLALRVLDGSVELGRFAEIPDDDIIAELTRVKGIGRWTAEMFLIFSLGRPDVFAVDDLGLRRAVHLAFERDKPLATEDIVALSDAWRPYRSVASLYLWEALDRKVFSAG